MKFSVLLPTRNRLNYLKYAVESVLRQEYSDWEIIISDNNSEEDVLGYVLSLKDSRIKYVKTKKFISVTDNWNNALTQSSGEYVIMLGDDDILLNNYFGTIIKFLSQFGNPNIIYHDAYVYAYPGAMLKYPEGFLQKSNYPLFNDLKEEKWLTKGDINRLIEGHCNFSPTFGANMQHVIVKRAHIQQLTYSNKFFHSPYPDFYAMFLLLFNTADVLISPKRLIVIGICPKSNGSFLFNRQEKESMEFLNVLEDLNSNLPFLDEVLPWSYNLNCWLIALETFKLHSNNSTRISANYKKYRFLQISYLAKKSKKTFHGMCDFSKQAKKLSLKEKVFIAYPLFFIHFFLDAIPIFCREILMKFMRKIKGKKDFTDGKFLSKKFSNIIEVLEAIKQDKLV